MKNTTGLYKYQRDHRRSKLKLSASAPKAKLVACVQAKCIGCGAKRDIYSYEVATGDHPCCGLCGMPMIAVNATASTNMTRSKE